MSELTEDPPVASRRTVDEPAKEPRPAASPSKLVLASALMLFVELALIRWTGSNILHLSYFSNFVLLGSFLGIGLGFLRARRSRDLSFMWPIVLVGLVGFILAFPVRISQDTEQLLYFKGVHPSGLPAWATLPVIFLAVAAVMCGLGETVGRLFGRFPALTAYRLDLIGSLVGIATFTALSFVHAPPVAWGALAATGFVALNRDRLRPPWLPLASLAVLVGLLAGESLQPNTTWSPYYKVVTRDRPKYVDIFVNGIPHQSMLNIKTFDPGLRTAPYERAPGNPLNHVLVVGAGNGNDVAVSLDRGAKAVDAVEIDPRIAQIGRERHPNRPYANSRVKVHIDDGRAFMQSTTTKYDLIVFALPDSQTLVSGNSSLRLESYLFTREAIATARSHLTAGGVFAMYNTYRTQWLIDRYAGTLAEVFGHSPCIDTVGGVGHRAALVVARDSGKQTCATTWQLATHPAPAVATDDHPFPYLRRPGIPGFYLLVLLFVLLAACVAVRVVGGPVKPMRPYADLFFLGAAFLLLETKNVAGFALLFGTTWLVNALVFAGVLVAVLAAVEVSGRVRLPRPAVLYALLAIALAIGWAVPADSLLSLPWWLRLGAAATLAFAPIFCANLIFSRRLAETASSTSAFGANLLGALLGGTLEYLALITGYRALLILAGALYVIAFVLTPRRGSLVTSN
ncbi:MAG: spermidine synthase [Pseudonocardiales bacterium]|nr:MAG: spermidine synthase [Pseudonocardiales bacterium]